MMYILAILFAVVIATDDDPACKTGTVVDCCASQGAFPDKFECGKGMASMMVFAEDSDCSDTPAASTCQKLGVCKMDDDTLPATCDALKTFAKDTLSISDFAFDTCLAMTADGNKVKVKVGCTDADKGSSSAAALSVAAVFSGLLAML